MRLCYRLPDICCSLTSSHIHLYNQLTRKWINISLSILPTSTLFPIPFAYFASFGEIVLVEYVMRRTLSTLPRELSFIHTIWRQEMSMLRKLLCMVFATLENLVDHRSRDVRSAHQAMQDSHLSHSWQLVEVTGSVIITTGSSVQ